ncbi:MAG: hypothetical protein HOP19_21370 [Acidobacteria bacterium]|nr:hypothetical protein [Acidobacteriota bacterium]
MIEISLKLSNQLYRNVSALAQSQKVSVAEVIKNAVYKTVSEQREPLGRTLAACSDEEVLALARMKMTAAEDQRMSELMEKKRENLITPLERNELEAWFRVYQFGNLRKSQGIAEAFHRGLIKTSDDLP